MRIAAIDIGSNAARLLIQDIRTYKDGSLDFTKINLVRIPLRLGFDVFETGFISELKIQQLIDTLMAYKYLLQVYDVHVMRACATSAMRDAINGKEIVLKVKKKTGIHIEIISGAEEAQILYETHLADTLDPKRNYLYIDVGGGSTELTLYSKQQTDKKSFNIGTIRMLKDQVPDTTWDELKGYVKSLSKLSTLPTLIGTGGNINKVFSLSKVKPGKPVSYELMRAYLKEMSPLTIEERIHKYGFKEDRADVIVPALQIYTSVMRWLNVQEIFVPQIGLADGIIKLLHRKMSFTSMMGKK
jgi:Exopolyphosphatase